MGTACCLPFSFFACSYLEGGHGGGEGSCVESSLVFAQGPFTSSRFVERVRVGTFTGATDAHLDWGFRGLLRRGRDGYSVTVRAAA